MYSLVCYLRTVENLAEEAKVAFARLVGEPAAIGENEAGHAMGSEVMEEMLQQGDVSVTTWTGRRTTSASGHPSETSGVR